MFKPASALIVLTVLTVLAACGGSASDGLQLGRVASDGGAASASANVARSEPIAADPVGGGANLQRDTGMRDSDFGAMLNNLRVETGVGPVRYDGRLDRAAQLHAEEMSRLGTIGHINADGDDVDDRIRAQNYDPIAWGENIGARQQSAEEVLRDWRNSSAHNRMMTAGTLEDFGLGMAGSGNDARWVLVMATER